MSRRDSHRRTAVKSLLWRYIGIFWTWGGAFVIIMLLPMESRKDPLLVATLVTAWHHSTRMVMYYFYERVWDRVSWGRDGEIQKLSLRVKVSWIASIILLVAFVFWLLMGVSPKIKEIQKSKIKNLSEEIKK